MRLGKNCFAGSIPWTESSSLWRRWRPPVGESTPKADRTVYDTERRQKRKHSGTSFETMLPAGRACNTSVCGSPNSILKLCFGRYITSNSLWVSSGGNTAKRKGPRCVAAARIVCDLDRHDGVRCLWFDRFVKRRVCPGNLSESRRRAIHAVACPPTTSSSEPVGSHPRCRLVNCGDRSAAADSCARPRHCAPGPRFVPDLDAVGSQEEAAES